MKDSEFSKTGNKPQLLSGVLHLEFSRLQNRYPELRMESARRSPEGRDAARVALGYVQRDLKGPLKSIQQSTDQHKRVRKIAEARERTTKKV